MKRRGFLAFAGWNAAGVAAVEVHETDAAAWTGHVIPITTSSARTDGLRDGERKLAGARLYPAAALLSGQSGQPDYSN
jgi:hypothetical protein